MLSGRLDRSLAHRTAAPLTVVEHLPGNPLSWTHEVLETAPTWTRYLLTPAQLSALHQLTDLPEFHPLSEVARLTVSTVTARQWGRGDESGRPES